MGDVHSSGPNQKPHNERPFMYADFMIENCWLAAMDSTQEQNFNFNEAVSLLIYCDTQKEIDYYWEKLSADPKAEQCGWLKDKFGLSWQVNPSTMEEMLNDIDPQRVKRVTEAFLKMKKFDLAKLEKAYHGA
jgi:predicted 3-demethylubiquinone-9 3-methyltransferase (glyoxalase superfamily)